MTRAALIALFLPAIARGHAVEHPRTGTLVVHPDGAEVTLRFEADPKQADDFRRLFDRNRDGAITGQEAEMLTRFLEMRARGSFRMSLDGRPLSFERVGGRTRGIADARGLVAGELSLRAKWPESKAFRLTVADGGDATGHLPLELRGDGVRATMPDLPRTTAAETYDLPANREAVVVVSAPAK